jgi:hypothetical protein
VRSPAEAFLGILMLDTRFPRPLGDIGNPGTFARAGIPARFAVVRGASPRRIVETAATALLPAFVDAALALVEQGACMISTSCGFLARHQAELTSAVPVPVLTSSLLQCREHARPGIVTFDRDALGVLAAASVPAGTPVEGLAPGCELHRRILGNDTALDVAEAERNVVDAACRLVEREPKVADIILECTNMPPYRHAVAKATGRRVHDIETFLIAAWALREGLQPDRFDSIERRP